MDRSTQRDLIVLFAGLAGVAAGYAVRSAMQPDDETEAHEAQLRAITIPSVMGAVGVSNRVGRMLPLDDDDIVVHAAIAASTGALLVYFAHGLGRILPRIASQLR
jgi:hypothetical protein